MGKKNKKQQVVRKLKPPSPSNQITTTTFEAVQFEGPLPPPAHFEGYERVLPGSAERILAMAENQTTHRHSLESKVINSDIVRANLGLIFGFIVALVGLGGGAFLINAGNTIAGSVFGGTTLVSMVGTFIYGSQERKKALEKKQ